ncbi:MAG: glycosyltransferase [Gammaproteobacteria bacterium]|nr:glycosyltransferase [Gammaproteobacteria bacterium]
MLLSYLHRAAASIKQHAHPWSLHARLLAIRAQRIRDVLGPLKPDLVHAHFGPNGIASAIALEALPKIPLIVNFHGHDVTAFPKHHGWDMYKALPKSTILIAHSDFVSHLISSRLNRHSVRVTMGVDTRLFSPERTRTSQWRPPLRILSVGRLESVKGHDVAIKALAIIRQRKPELDARLRIVGHGSQRESLSRLIKSLGLTN